MKKLRRIAALFLALFLGAAAWLVVMVSLRTEGELQLSRELSTGRLVARVPPPQGFLRFIDFGPAQLAGRFSQPALDRSGPLPPGIVLVETPREGWEQVWHVNLDPLDKSWELEVVESRPVYLRLAGKRGRLGTKARVWRTHRSSVGSD